MLKVNGTNECLQMQWPDWAIITVFLTIKSLQVIKYIFY